MPSAHLLRFLDGLRCAPIVSRPPDEAWPDLIARASQTGVICAIDEETFDYFLEVLPPKYQGHGFAFAEGAEALRYFWCVRPDHFFCRQLTMTETEEFCRLAEIPLPH